MTASNDIEPILDAWLNAGHDVLPDRSIHAVLATVQKTPQRSAWRAPWRTPTVNGNSRLALMAGAAVFVVVVVGGLAYLGGSRAPSVTGGVGPAPSPGTTPSTTLTPSPGTTPSTTLTPSPTPTANASLQAAGWINYHSDRYGFDIGYPADWNVGQTAQRDWTYEADATNALSPATEDFTSPDGHVRLSAWSVPFPAGSIGSFDDVEPWVEEYCHQTGNTDCAGIRDRAVPLCLESRDCHPGLLVPFENDVQAFFKDGFTNSDRMIVVAVWWGESQPAVAPYGGSERLLEDFLSTMTVWPESVPFEERVPAPAPVSATAPPTATAGATPTATPGPTAIANGWTTYTSARYGFTLGYPDDWNVGQTAQRDWTFKADATDPLSPATDDFTSPDGHVRVSAWSAPLAPDSIDTFGTSDVLEPWVEAYCQKTGNTDCSGIHERAVPLCLEKWDCHPGLLVPFESDVQAFFTGGIYDADRMIVVAVWRGDSDPAVAQYGGSQRLLEDILSTMQVWPASVPRSERVQASPPTPLPLPTANPSPIATSDWVPFTSARYGFTMSHPADWSTEPSTRAWTLGVDVRDRLTPAADTFLAPGRAVRFAVFAAPMPGGRTGDWIESYMGPRANGSRVPCLPTTVYMSPTTVDGHPTTFRADPDTAECGGTFAFVPVGDQMYVFAVWLPGYEPLLTAFLSTVRFDS